MFKCPHCHEKSISFTQKFFLVLQEKNRNYTCKKCGGLVTVSFGLTLLLIPVILIPLMVIAERYFDFINSDFIEAVIFFLGTIAAVSLIVPLKGLKAKKGNEK